MLDTSQHPLLAATCPTCGHCSAPHATLADPRSSPALLRKLAADRVTFAELALQASTDPLTGLLNRRAFEAELAERLESAPDGSLLLLDLDRFKRLNDRLGHATGDRALVSLANTLRQAFRPGDLMARLGGDEFAVWMAGAGAATAVGRAGLLCHDARLAIAAALPARAPRVSVSIGVAQRDTGHGLTAATLLERADAAMYAAKRAGRGRWTVWTTTPLRRSLAARLAFAR